MFSKSHTKYIQSLQHKKFRDEEAAFVVEGSKVVFELLQSGKFTCKDLVALPEWFQKNEIELAKYYSGELLEVKDFELEKISTLSTPNQVLAVFKKAVEQPVKLTGKITLALADIQDPGNMGAIIRIADWFGIESVVCSHNSVDVYNSKVIQSTMGSIARVNVVYADLEKWLQQSKRVKIYAAVLEGKKINTIQNLKEAIIIIGNESKGISNEILQLANEKITIPKVGKAESLNAAVATGIILSHIAPNP